MVALRIGPPGALAVGRRTARAPSDADLLLEVVSDVLAAVRRAKTAAGRSMRTPVDRLTVTDTAPRLAALALGADDLGQAGGVADLATVEGADHGAEVVLAAPE